MDSDTLPPAHVFSKGLTERAVSIDSNTLSALPASAYALAQVADRPSRGQGERSMRDSIDAAMRSSADMQQQRWVAEACATLRLPPAAPDAGRRLGCLSQHALWSLARMQIGGILVRA